MLHRITQHSLSSLRHFTKPNLARNLSTNSFLSKTSNLKCNPSIPTTSTCSFLHRNAVFVSPIVSARYSTKKSPDEELEDELAEEAAASSSDFGHTHLPATVAIPEVWPHLPVIATKRNPVFPRFMKILEVSWIYVKFKTFSCWLFKRMFSLNNDKYLNNLDRFRSPTQY